MPGSTEHAPGPLPSAAERTALAPRATCKLPRPAPSPHQPPTLALLIALALHAAVPVFLRATAHPSLRPLVLDVAAAPELSLVADEPLPGRGAAQAGLSARLKLSATTITPRHTGPRAPGHSLAAVRAAAPSPAPALSSAASPPEALSSPAGNAAPRTIDLGLNDGVRRAALAGGWVERPPLPSRPSDGGLRQGLAALDAERGLARSSAATHAAYEAARHFAPQTGIGVFDLTTDERGLVLSVTLIRASANESDWRRVEAALQQLLQARRLRVPAGARGLVARLSIETGELAQDNAERFRSERAPALGQAPGHARELRAESTRSSLEPGQLTPTLGVTIVGGGSRGNVRVVLLDERAL